MTIRLSLQMLLIKTSKIVLWQALILNTFSATITPTSMIKKYSKEIIVIVLSLVLIAIFVIAQSGWRFSDLPFSQAGKIELMVPEKDSFIFLDGKEVGITTTDGEIYKITGVRAGERQVLVAKDDFWPWAKTIAIGKKEIYPLQSFYLPQRLDLERLPAGERFNNARLNISRSVLPTENSKISSTDGNTSLWVDKNKIFIEWSGEESETPRYFCSEGICEERIEVISSLSNIVSVDFFKNRNDLIVFSSEEGIFVIEADKTDTQNFQPILRTRNPKFYQTADGFFVETPGEISFIAI